MARTFRRPRSLQPIAELNVTNMIDLGFTLLIIFMITTPLIQQEQTIAVNLPSESARAIAKPPPGTTYQPISIDARGQYYFGQNRVSFAELENHVAELAARPKPHVVRIRADQALQFQQVVRLMNLLMRHNLTKVTFDTQTAR